MKRLTFLAALSVFGVLSFATAAGAQAVYPQDQTQAPVPSAPAATGQYMQEAPAPGAPAAMSQYVGASVPAGAQDRGTTTISIQDFYFSPARLTISPGTTVTWVNDGQAPHTVTAYDGSFGSGTLQPGQSFSFTFRNAGTFAYFCEIHPDMTASVTVSGGGANARGGGASGMGAHPLPGTGGPSLLLPAVGLLLAVSSGILVLAVRRRRV